MAEIAEREKVQGDLFHGAISEGSVYVGRQCPGLKRSDFANPFKPGALYAEPDKPMRVPPLSFERSFRKLKEGDTFTRLIGGRYWVYTIRRVAASDHATALFIAWAQHVRFAEGGETFRERCRRELAGKKLACWCKLGQPCHADAALIRWAAGFRAWTPDVVINGKTTMHVKRACNGCGELIGDVTSEEIFVAHLPDVRPECPDCSKETADA